MSFRLIALPVFNLRAECSNVDICGKVYIVLGLLPILIHRETLCMSFVSVESVLIFHRSFVDNMSSFLVLRVIYFGIRLSVGMV